MQDSYEMFLLVAEELSFTKAAEKAYVTQQTASYHINTLEKEHDIVLFVRKPILKLTDAGKLFYENVKNIKAMELSLKQQISEIRGETVGELRIGINTVRARILLPEILYKYMAKYPEVKTSFYINDTWILSDMLIDNKIDLFIGIETDSKKAFKRTKIYDESIYFIATREFLHEKANFIDSEIDEAKKNGISIERLNEVPTIRNLDGCSFNNIIDRNIRKYDIHLPEVINTSDYDIQIEFCGNNLTGAFCPTMILSRVLEFNRINSPSRKILYFKINEMEEKLRIDLVTSAVVPAPKYLEEFITYFVEEAEKKYSLLEKEK